MHTLLLHVLVVFFGSLVLTQVIMEAVRPLAPVPFSPFLSNNVEGMETQTDYKEYQPNDALMLAQQNAGNIEYLKQQMGKLDGVQGQVADLSNNLQTLQTQVAGLMQAQQDYATQLTGGSAPAITGVVDDEEEDPIDATPVEPFSSRLCASRY